MGLEEVLKSFWKVLVFCPELWPPCTYLQ